MEPWTTAVRCWVDVDNDGRWISTFIIGCSILNVGPAHLVKKLWSWLPRAPSRLKTKSREPIKQSDLHSPRCGLTSLKPRTLTARSILHRSRLIANSAPAGVAAHRSLNPDPAPEHRRWGRSGQLGQTPTHSNSNGDADRTTEDSALGKGTPRNIQAAAGRDNAGNVKKSRGDRLISFVSVCVQLGVQARSRRSR